jgi:hypothetical protein
MELCLHSAIRLLAMVLKYSSTGITLTVLRTDMQLNRIGGQSRQNRDTAY